MKKPTSIFFVTFLLIFSDLSFSQEPGINGEWTLKQCIDYALDHNLRVKQAGLNSEISKQNLLQSKAQALPNLNGYLTHNYNFGQTIDPYTNQFATDRVQSNNFALSSSVTLFNGFQTLNNFRQNQLSYLAGKSEEEKMKFDISINIASAYLIILYSEEAVVTAKNQSAITGLQLSRMEKMVNAGALPKSKILELEAQMALEELNVVNAENQKDLSYLTLKQLLDIDAAKELKIAQPEILISAEMSIKSTPGQIYDAALSILPEIKTAEFHLLGSERTLKIAQGGMSPRLSLQGSIATGFSGLRKDIISVTPTGYKASGYFTATGVEVVEPTYNVQSKVRPFNNQINDNFNKSIGLNLSIPIFNSLQVKTNISKAKIARQKAEYDLAITKNQVQKNVQQAYADALAALKKYNATKKSLEALTESFKYADKRFSVGDINSVEYSDAKNKLAKVQSDLLQAKYDFIFKQKILDVYQGKALVL